MSRAIPKRNASYPAPDRSNFTPDKYRDDPELPEGDLGAHEGVLADGRPYRAEAWFSEGYTWLTVFFSVLGLEDGDPVALLELVSPALEEDGVPPRFRRLEANSVRRISDAKGNEMFTLTFAVGEPAF